LLTLAAQSEEEARPLLPLVQGLTVSADQSWVTVRFRYPSSKLIQLAHELNEQHDLHRGIPISSPPSPDHDGDKRTARPKLKKKDGWY
jgi:hypothetical protein